HERAHVAETQQASRRCWLDHSPGHTYRRGRLRPESGPDGSTVQASRHGTTRTGTRSEETRRATSENDHGGGGGATDPTPGRHGPHGGGATDPTVGAPRTPRWGRHGPPNVFS